MKKTLIVSGGNINLDFLNEVILEEKFDNIIASDKGLEALDRLRITPDYIIGDFDSINKKILNKYINNKTIKIAELNPEKDYTDTNMAIKLAMEILSTNIIIIGAIGTRIDHTIANIHVLKEALDNNVECMILDENNKIKLVNKKTIIYLDKKYKYISLIPLTSKVEGITIKGFKYSLLEEDLEIGKSLGVSNEQIENRATIDLKSGILILIQSKD